MVGVAYMLPLALSIACSARVSFWMGAGHPHRASTTARLGLSMAVTLATDVALLLWLLF